MALAIIVATVPKNKQIRSIDICIMPTIIYKLRPVLVSSSALHFLGSNLGRPTTPRSIVFFIKFSLLMTSITDTVYYQLYLNQTLEVVLGKYFFSKLQQDFRNRAVASAIKMS